MPEARARIGGCDSARFTETNGRPHMCELPTGIAASTAFSYIMKGFGADSNCAAASFTGSKIWRADVCYGPGFEDDGDTVN